MLNGRSDKFYGTRVNTNKTFPLYSSGVLYGKLFLVSLPSVALFKLHWVMRWRLIWTVGEQFIQHICSFSEVHLRWEYDDVYRSAVEIFCRNSSLFINYIYFEIM